MSRPRPRALVATLLASLAVACATRGPAARSQARWPDGTTAMVRDAGTRDGACASDGPPVSLDLRSDFWLNLHDFLVREAKRRRGVRDESPAAFRVADVADDDALGARPLTAAERERWSRVLDAYDRGMRESTNVDSVFIQLNVRLSEAAEEGELPDVVISSPLSPSLGDALRAGAPIYRAVWWPAHDRRNREWIAAMRAQLAGGGACLLRREAALFRGRWPLAAMPVEASVYASWFGAYTSLAPLQVTVSSVAVGTQGTLGLEVLLHEAGHAVLDPVDSALAASARRQRRRLPGELSHLVLFYTAGALVRTRAPAHVPFAEQFGVWRQNETARRYLGILEKAWWPYLAGEIDFDAAIDGVVRELDPLPG
jgi:hypothetical protein